MESGLTFAGFFICNSPLKEDTLQHIESLQNAKYNLLIITGDNILTAMKVAHSLKFADRIYEIELIDDKIVLQKPLVDPILINSPSEIDKHLEDGAILATSSSKGLDSSYLIRIKIFARASPQDKETVIKAYQSKGFGVLYSGDGTNDVGGLRVADVGVAVVGTSKMSDVQEK